MAIHPYGNHAESMSLGYHGFKQVTSGTETGDFYCIYPTEASTFSATSSEGDNLSAITTSVPVYGNFSSVTVTSGDVLLYNTNRVK